MYKPTEPTKLNRPIPSLKKMVRAYLGSVEVTSFGGCRIADLLAIDGADYVEFSATHDPFGCLIRSEFNVYGRETEEDNDEYEQQMENYQKREAKYDAAMKEYRENLAKYEKWVEADERKRLAELLAKYPEES